MWLDWVLNLGPLALEQDMPLTALCIPSTEQVECTAWDIGRGWCVFVTGWVGEEGGGGHRSVCHQADISSNFNGLHFILF